MTAIQTQTTEIIPLHAEGCGVTEDGNSYCSTSPDRACGCGTTTHATKATNQPAPIVFRSGQWAKLRSGALVVVACLTSPCCTPLYVPLLLVLFTGTPFAVWLGANVGWVYGGLTLVSVVSGFMAWRSWQAKRA